MSKNKKTSSISKEEKLMMSQEEAKNSNDQLSNFSDFCLSDETSQILTPFSHFSSWPQYLQNLAMTLASREPHFLKLPKLENQGNFKDDFELMRSLALAQDLVIEKWMIKKCLSTKNKGHYEELAMFRETKTAIKAAFQEFFEKKMK